MKSEELTSLLNAMAGSISVAAELFGKDADLDRNDLLGDIDLGAARQAFDLARSYATDIITVDRTHPAFASGPGMALRRMAELLVAQNITIYEAFIPTLGRLVDAALTIPQTATTGPKLAAFDKDYQAAFNRLSHTFRGRE
jgi:hypothetical protein